MSLHKAFRSGLEKLPNAAVERVLASKLKKAGVRTHKATAKKLADHLLSGSEEPFKWGDGEAEQVFEISLTEEDIQEIKKRSRDLVASVPEVVKRVSHRIAEDFALRYASDWKRNRYLEERSTRGFRDRLEERWGDGLDGLRILLTTSRHLGQLSFNRLSASRARKGKIRNSVLCRLHIRACQISAEIIALLENGFADGAMVRWRTLHEVSVVALLISDNDDDLAQRYTDHDTVEAKKALDRFRQDFAALGERPISKRSAEKIDRTYAGFIEKYGSSFKTEYGWASSLLEMARPRFIDLQDAAGRGPMHSHYKNASYNVHAGPRALSLRVSNIHNNSVMIAGASNGGIDDVGIRLAESLAIVTSTLPGGKFSVDNAIWLLTVAKLRDRATSALLSAGAQLRRDDLEIRKALAEQGDYIYVQDID